MKFDVPLPSLGDDGTVMAEVAVWLADIGATLNEGDDLVEMTTDKAAFTVASPKSGKLVERRVAEGDEINTGDIIAVLEV